VTARLLANKPDGPVEIPDLVRQSVKNSAELDVVWRNELGGLTFRDGDRFLKWTPLGGGIDLRDEHARIRWAAGQHPVPVIIDLVEDAVGQLLVTRALPGAGAATDAWRARPREAVHAIADGLRALHRLPADECPFVCEWAVGDSAAGDSAEGDTTAGDTWPQDRVVVQGDACVPNTVIGPDARFVGHVDLGALGVADRWADLAIASRSLDWNYGPGWQDEFFAAYGIERDEQRIQYYRALCDAAP
jgi:kanamycin kinase